MKVFLIGFMGSGKSTVGKALAKQLQIPLVDSDHWIEEQTGVSISELFEHEGETVFRDWEQQFIERLPETPQIVSCGGGLPCFNELMEVMLQKGTVIYLETSELLLFQRLQFGKSRPLLNSLSDDELTQQIHERLAKRSPIYQQAQHTIRVDGKSLVTLVEEIGALIGSI